MPDIPNFIASIFTSSNQEFHSISVGIIGFLQSLEKVVMLKKIETINEREIQNNLNIILDTKTMLNMEILINYFYILTSDRLKFNKHLPNKLF